MTSQSIEKGICEDCYRQTTVAVTTVTTPEGHTYVTRCICAACQEK